MSISFIETLNIYHCFLQVGKSLQQCLQGEVLQHPLQEVGLLLLLQQQQQLHLKRVSEKVDSPVCSPTAYFYELF
jgi:hypothetical protein